MTCDLHDVLGGLHKPGIYELEEMLEAIGERMIKDAQAVNPVMVGLDIRAASCLWIGPDFIAVARSNVRTLEYYGGFEYVDKTCRRECGSYVFYSHEDARVMGHINHLEGQSNES